MEYFYYTKKSRSGNKQYYIYTGRAADKIYVCSVPEKETAILISEGKMEPPSFSRQFQNYLRQENLKRSMNLLLCQPWHKVPEEVCCRPHLYCS